MSEQYHIRCKPGDVGRYVLLPGDPGRCALIAAYFDDARLIAQNREYTTYTGTLDGVPVSATSTGIGGPSTAIAAEELCAIGADTLIRVGTSGAMQNFLRNGDLVIAQAAVRDEGTSGQYIPLSYPAVASLDTVLALQQSAREQGARCYTGIVRSGDALYVDLAPSTIPLNALAGGSSSRMWSEARVLCSDMEAATLFVVSSIRGLRAGTILLVVNAVGDGEIEETNAGQNALDGVIRAAVGSLRALIAADAAALR
ncbi:MAG: udp [Chloroflexi bacterium]|nr:udp [Chloroflexota bacterium]